MDVSATIGLRATIAEIGVGQGHTKEVLARPADDLEPDEHLMCKVNCGDKEALSYLFRRYAVMVHRVGKRILRDSGEADDLVQEVFLYLNRKSTSFDSSKGSARSWIFQVAYTQAFMRRRKLKAHGFYASGIVDTSTISDSGNSSGTDYEHTVEGIFGRNGWKKILESLTQEQCQTLRLHFFEGYTFEEIAGKLGQSYANVRNHYYRGLEKIRRHLAEDELKRR